MAESQEQERLKRDIDEALRRAGADRLAHRKRFRLGFRLPFDPRPAGPGQVILAAVVLIVLWRFRLLGGGLGVLAAELGVFLLAFGVATWLIHPRRRTVKWRERTIDVGASLTWPERLYYLFYKG